MARSDNLMELPKDLPAPQDDGACAHLTGLKLPAITLRSTRGRAVDLAKLRGTTVVYIYPRTGRPDRLERHTRRARLHAAIVRVPRPLPGTEGPRRG